MKLIIFFFLVNKFIVEKTAFIAFRLRFKCPDFTKYSPDKCYFNGKVFNVGEEITGNLPECRPACFCYKPDNNTAAEIICAVVDCFFGNESCFHAYDNLGQCCSTKEICGRNLIKKFYEFFSKWNKTN